MAVQMGQIHFSRGCIVSHSENGPKLPSSFPMTDEHLDAASFSLTGSAAQYILSLATCSQHFTEGIMSSSILQIYPSTPEVPCSVTHLDRVSLCPNAPPSAQSWLSWPGGEGPSIFDSRVRGQKEPSKLAH